jgi:hypothetical protein
MTTRNEILAAAMLLSEQERLEIAGELLETIPDDSSVWASDEEFLDELDRRRGDLEGSVPADEVWQHESRGE